MDRIGRDSVQDVKCEKLLWMTTPIAAGYFKKKIKKCSPEPTVRVSEIGKKKLVDRKRVKNIGVLYFVVVIALRRRQLDVQKINH